MNQMSFYVILPISGKDLMDFSICSQIHSNVYPGLRGTVFTQWTERLYQITLPELNVSTNWNILKVELGNVSCRAEVVFAFVLNTPEPEPDLFNKRVEKVQP